MTLTAPPAADTPWRRRTTQHGARAHVRYPADGPVAVSVVYFVAVASLWLSRPGLEMDEVNFVDASLGGYGHQIFVSERLLGIPLLVIPYIGTLKAAVFAPIFAVFGVSVATVRLPAIAISAASLVLSRCQPRSGRNDE